MQRLGSPTCPPLHTVHPRCNLGPRSKHECHPETGRVDVQSPPEPRGGVLMDPSETSENDGIRNIKKTFPSTGCSGAPGTPEGRAAGVADADQLTQGCNHTRETPPALEERRHTHPTPDMKRAVVNSVTNGSSRRTAAECWCATGAIPSLIKRSQQEPTPGHGQGGESTVKRPQIL